jgi:hypothetical protein
MFPGNLKSSIYSTDRLAEMPVFLFAKSECCYTAFVVQSKSYLIRGGWRCVPVMIEPKYIIKRYYCSRDWLPVRYDGVSRRLRLPDDIWDKAPVIDMVTDEVDLFLGDLWSKDYFDMAIFTNIEKTKDIKVDLCTISVPLTYTGFFDLDRRQALVWLALFYNNQRACLSVDEIRMSDVHAFMNSLNPIVLYTMLEIIDFLDIKTIEYLFLDRGFSIACQPSKVYEDSKDHYVPYGLRTNMVFHDSGGLVKQKFGVFEVTEGIVIGNKKRDVVIAVSWGGRGEDNSVVMQPQAAQCIRSSLEKYYTSVLPSLE